jgi:hypothetical protein
VPYTLLSRTEINAGSTSQIDIALTGDTADYDELYFVISGFKSNTDERVCGWQVITSGESGYDRPTQATCIENWLYAHDYSHGAKRYHHTYDKQHTEAASSSTQYNVILNNGDTSKAHANQSGELTLFKHANTSFYKYFLTVGGGYDAHIHEFQQYSSNTHIAGYIKDNNALTGIRFVSCNYAGDKDGLIANIGLSMYGLA